MVVLQQKPWWAATHLFADTAFLPCLQNIFRGRAQLSTYTTFHQKLHLFNFSGSECLNGRPHLCPLLWWWAFIPGIGMQPHPARLMDTQGHMYSPLKDFFYCSSPLFFSLFCYSYHVKEKSFRERLPEKPRHIQMLSFHCSQKINDT